MKCHNFLYDNKIYLMNFQLATNTLERVAPLTHAVGNVLKRVFVIGFSIVVFGKSISLFLYIFPFLINNLLECNTEVIAFGM